MEVPRCPACETALKDWPYLWPDPHCVHCGVELPFMAREVLQQVLRTHSISLQSVESIFRTLGRGEEADHYRSVHKQSLSDFA